MDIITTPSAPDANSYLSLDDANTILDEQRLWTTKWDATSDDDKTRALLYATRILDTFFIWEGTIAVYPSQKLAWPRYGVVDRERRLYDNTTIPDVVQQATAELALFLLTRDRTAEPQIWSQGLSELRVGPIDLKVDRRRDQAVDFIPDSVVALLSDVGELAPGVQSGGFQIVPLYRG